MLGERGGVSWWYGAVGRADGVGLVGGADGATVLRTYVAADGARVRLIMGAGETLVLAPGETRTLDGVVLALGDVLAGLDAYAGVVAKKHPPPVPRKPALGGWGSWNLYYDAPTAAALREEMTFAKESLAPHGMKDFLLDDGYEPFWGDWTAKPEFGAELGAFAAEQTAAGLVPAIWLAPFCVDVRSQTFAQHPEWLVQDEGGKPKTVTEISNLTWAALDVTNDDARAHLSAILSGLFAKGYRTFKLDYLYAGAIEGKRQKPVTSLEALADGLRAMREAVPDAHLVGCGAPQLPSVGWFDSMRTGPDIAFKNVPEPRYGFALAQARHTVLRAHTDAFWSLDPDVVLLRGTGIDDTVAWTHVVSMAMAGGNWLLGDARQTTPARLKMALLPDVLAMVRDGIAARPLDGLAQKDGAAVGSPILDPNGRSEVPHVWRKSTRDGRTYVAVFAWGEERYAADVDLVANAEEIGPDGAARRVEGAGRKVRVEVPQHAVRLFRALPAR